MKGSPFKLRSPLLVDGLGTIKNVDLPSIQTPAATTKPDKLQSTVGKALRAFGGRDAKIREVDPIVAKKEEKENEGGEGRFSL